MRTATGDLIQVVGVAQDTSDVRFGEPDGPILYVPWDSNARLYDLVVRVAGNDMEESRAVAAAVRETVPGVFAQVQTIQGWMDERVESFKTLVIMVLILGCLAVSLTIMGIYGVVSFAVSRRTKEMGIRVALGASKRHIVGTVLRSGFQPIAVGMVIGILLAVPASVVLDRVLQRSPFAVDSRDPFSFAAVSSILAAVALLAMLGPARQAASIDPIQALRAE
jgi:ABC-type antimicrobial peptide transport system permease subunit